MNYYKNLNKYFEKNQFSTAFLPRHWKSCLDNIDHKLSQIEQAIEITKKLKLCLVFLKEDNHNWVIGESFDGIHGWFQYRQKTKRILPIKVIVDERNILNYPWFQAACLPSQKSNELLKQKFPSICKNQASILDHLKSGIVFDKFFIIKSLFKNI